MIKNGFLISFYFRLIIILFTNDSSFAVVNVATNRKLVLVVKEN